MEQQIDNLNSLDIASLEGLVREYPWFTSAREILMEKLAAKGKEHLELQINKCSAFLVNRSRFYLLTLEPQEEEDASVIDFDEINREFNEITRGLGDVVAENERLEGEKSQNSPKYIVLGGDYFTKEDFDGLDTHNSFKIGKLGDIEMDADQSAEIDGADNQAVESTDEGGELDDFYTETLARIYAEQGYYEEAIKVYAKLILLYPEKSAYFATLVNEVKSKNN